jgi:hypothetical protein
MREGPLDMVFHGVLLALVLYVLMHYVLGQSQSKSLARSVLVGSLAVSYMVLFGHRLPGRVNSNVM